MSRNPIPVVPHSWSIADWPSSVYPNDSKRGRYLVREHKADLHASGALVRVGRELVSWARDTSAFSNAKRRACRTSSARLTLHGSNMRLNLMPRAVRASLRGAINGKCRDCIYDPLSGGGTWREQIAQCSVISCSLWPVRPGPESGPYAEPPRDPPPSHRHGCVNLSDGPIRGIQRQRKGNERAHRGAAHAASEARLRSPR